MHINQHLINVNIPELANHLISICNSLHTHKPACQPGVVLVLGHGGERDGSCAGESIRMPARMSPSSIDGPLRGLGGAVFLSASPGFVFNPGALAHWRLAN